MKRLAVVRHAEAGSARVDLDRSLTGFGIKEAEKSGIQLSAYVTPQKVLVSPALRTRMTAEALKTSMNLDGKLIHFDKKIYDASADMLFKLIRELSDDLERVILVGHNPGVSMFVSMLTQERIGFSTASFAIIDFDVESWGNISHGKLTATYSP